MGRLLLSACRFLRKYLTEEHFLKAASVNFYGSTTLNKNKKLN